ncbi:MAG: hypothetical protein E6Q66_09950 [Pedobacter sp.]|jgi:hypothetical protein|nr:MAG: hypothetical protein E6Q66_09950 [Pedobacter sp.]
MAELVASPLINGRSYGWGDIVVNVGALPITGITAIKYEEEQEKEDVYGAGRRPVARGYGRIKASASITLSVETVMALTGSAREGQLNRMAPFTITVLYQPESGPIIKDVLMNCEFKKQSRDWKEGDMKKEVELELLVSHIEWNR